MRNLITDYSFTPETRVITLDKFSSLGVENVRLIVNETQKFVICSSMLKANITIEGNKITYTDTLPALEWDDVLTIEVDMGTDVVYMGGTDWIINAKRDAVENGEDAQDLIITREMGEYLKPLAEVEGGSAAGSYLLNCALADCATVSADLSSWERISTHYGCHLMFTQNTRLQIVDLSGLRFISGYYAASRMFENCTALQSIDFSNLQTISGDNAAALMFQYCYSLQSIDLSNLRSISGVYAATQMFQYCYSLKSIDFSNLQTTSGSNATQFMFQYCDALREIKIHCGALMSSATGSNPLASATNITDLYLYGTPTNNIYLTWQGSLNFDSVKRILEKLCEVNGSFTCQFKSGFSVTDDENGTLATLKASAIDEHGWTIQNLTIN